MAPYGDDILLICTRCNEKKSLDSFYKEPRNTVRHSRRSHCKKCDSDKNKIYRSKNAKMMDVKTLQYRRMKKAFFPPGLYEIRLAEQGGVCAICKTNTPGGRGQFHADHNHETSKPRGVLCHNCNVALGNFQDNLEILEAAIEYLKKYSEAK